MAENLPGFFLLLRILKEESEESDQRRVKNLEAEGEPLYIRAFSSDLGEVEILGGYRVRRNRMA